MGVSGKTICGCNDSNGAAFVNHPVGTGPYVLASARQNYRYEDRANPQWPATGRTDAMPDGATMLALRTDKEKYAPGEKIKVTLPSVAGARALVSLEDGRQVREIFWVKTIQALYTPAGFSGSASIASGSSAQGIR